MIRAVLFLITFSLLACSTVSQHPIDWPKVAQCGPVNDIIAIVERILLADGPSTKATLSERAKAELEDLARTNGADTVACVLDQVIQDWTAPGAAQNDMRMGALKRGQAFADQIGTKVQR